MKANRFMIYAFSAMMLGSLAACSDSNDDPDNGGNGGGGGNEDKPYVWGEDNGDGNFFSAKSVDHLLKQEKKTLTVK